MSKRLTCERLNSDSSWLLTSFDEKGAAAVRVLLDPWLVGPNVDFSPVFSQQEHTGSCATVDSLAGKYDHIVITYPFTDHCSEQTCRLLPQETPVLVAKQAYSAVIGWRHFRTVLQIHVHGEEKDASNTKPLITMVRGTGMFNVTLHAFIFDMTTALLVYAPHGMATHDIHLLKAALGDRKVDLLLTSTIKNVLPWYLNGTVSAGPEAAIALADALRPATFCATHDENKTMAGLVGTLLKRSAWEPGELSKALTPLTHVEHIGSSGQSLTLSA